MTPPSASFEITTRLAAPADRVWASAITERGINDELRPLLRMTRPPGLREGMTIEDVPLGEPLGRSWLLAGGLLPLDYDALCLVERGPGMRFLERSSMGSARHWQHEREVRRLGEAACELTDRLELELRAGLRAVPGSARIARRTVAALFSHRHRRLLRRWGRA